MEKIFKNITTDEAAEIIQNEINNLPNRLRPATDESYKKSANKNESKLLVKYASMRIFDYESKRGDLTISYLMPCYYDKEDDCIKIMTTDSDECVCELYNIIGWVFVDSLDELLSD